MREWMLGFFDILIHMAFWLMMLGCASCCCDFFFLSHCYKAAPDEFSGTVSALLREFIAIIATVQTVKIMW